MSLREKNKARTRSAIVDAAKMLAKEGQWDAVTTRQIADAAGVSYQTLYNYYPAKALEADLVDFAQGVEQVASIVFNDIVYRRPRANVNFQ